MVLAAHIDDNVLGGNQAQEEMTNLFDDVMESTEEEESNDISDDIIENNDKDDESSNLLEVTVGNPSNGFE